MNSFDHRSVRPAMIPWIIALIVSIGLGALAPAHPVVKRDDSRGEVAVPASEHAQALGRLSHHTDYLVPPPCDAATALSLSSSLVCVETRREVSAVPSPRGAIRGRAPPVQLWV